MKTLYIFPHPDDESFGPAPVIYRQIQNGEEVHLLTLTKGGATKMRFKYNLSIEQMGEVRYQEMLKVEQILGLSSMTVLDLEDGGMAQMDPLDIEALVRDHVKRIQPDIVVTYPIHGISGHHDHLTIHAVIKNLYCRLREQGLLANWRRLAFFTLPRPEGTEKTGGNSYVNRSKSKDIDCLVKLNQAEQIKLKEALFCYESFMDVIRETNVIEGIGDRVHFEFFDEQFDPPVANLIEQLSELS